MYQFIIQNYVDNLTIDQIINYAKKENISITLDEANIIYDYIKKYWLIFYKGNPNELLIKLKKRIRPDTYNSLINLYQKYKKF